jgi:hypothetical protein
MPSRPSSLTCVGVLTVTRTRSDCSDRGVARHIEKTEAFFREKGILKELTIGESRCRLVDGMANIRACCDMLRERPYYIQLQNSTIQVTVASCFNIAGRCAWFYNSVQIHSTATRTCQAHTCQANFMPWVNRISQVSRTIIYLHVMRARRALGPLPLTPWGLRRSCSTPRAWR